MRFSETKTQMRRSGPLLGEDTADVLAEIGLSESEVAGLSERGIVGGACVLS